MSKYKMLSIFTEMAKLAISSIDRDCLMQKFVDELEDWKEKQQELFKCQVSFTYTYTIVYSNDSMIRFYTP